MTIFRLAMATLFPALIAVPIYLIEKKTALSRLSYWYKQIIIGIVFGGIAVLATEFGIPVDGAILNVRTAAPLTAGLLFGGPAGIIAGLIGGVERWFSVCWGGGEYTQLACTLATIMAGLFAALMRKYMFDNKKASFTAGFTIGLTTEVLHMLLVFVTNMSDIHTAIAVVQKCAPLMVLLNATAVALALGVVKLIGKEKRDTKKEHRQISQIFRSGLLVCVVAAFVATCVFTTVLQMRIEKEDTESTLRKGIDKVPKQISEMIEDSLLETAHNISQNFIVGESDDNNYLKTISEINQLTDLFVVSSDNDEILQSTNAKIIGTKIPKNMRLENGTPHLVSKIKQSLISNDMMQYCSVALDTNRYMIVGFDEFTITYQMYVRFETAANCSPIGQSGYLMICDKNKENKTIDILGDGNGNVGKTLSDIGLSLDGVKSDTVIHTRIKDTPVYMMTRDISFLDFTYTIIAVLPESEAVFARNTSVYIIAFMEILVFAVLFVNVYFMTKRVVVDNIHKVNGSLAKITGGNLNEQVNVRDNEEFASLTDDINSTVNTLKHYIDEAAARIDKELEFAKAIQYSALPSVFPPYPNRKDFDIFALMNTAKEVGGDFYDFYLLDNDRLGFLIADVSGKGIPAAMFMMTAKTVIKGLAESGIEVNDIFNQANATLCEGNETGMFVTAWIGILDLRTGLLSFANAGHNPPLIRHTNGDFDFLRTRPNFILGGMKNTRYKKQELQLSPGDEIFLYTDGVTEAKNADKQMFREENLIKTLNKNPDEDVESRCKNLLSKIGMFVGETEQFDDITMLSVKLNHLQTFDRIVVYPDIASTDSVWEFIDFKIKKAELSRKLSAKLKVCIDEVYSNILLYSKATKAEILCRIDESIFTLVFRDNGIPYDPTAAAEPDVTLSANDREIGGLGIFMVKKSVKSIDYAYIDNQNVLTLTFDL